MKKLFQNTTYIEGEKLVMQIWQTDEGNFELRTFNWDYDFDCSDIGKGNFEISFVKKNIFKRFINYCKRIHFRTFIKVRN